MKTAIAAALLCAFTLTASAVSPAYNDAFDGLHAELVFRSQALSNSTDKIEIKQKKLCDQSVILIEKEPNTLAKDIRTGKKVAIKMIKAFPCDFIPCGTAESVTFSSIVPVLLNTFQLLGADVQNEIITLGGLLAGLPPGTALVKAAAQFDAATNFLAQAQIAPTFATGSALLNKSLKAALKGQKIALAAGGGGGNNTISATVIIGGTNYNWSATGGAEWVQNAGILDIGGTDGTLQVSAAQCTNFPGTAGNYALGDSCGGVFDFGGPTFYGAVAGTLHIAAFSTATTSLSGTFAYTAVSGATTVTVQNGTFDLSNLLITNNP